MTPCCLLARANAENCPRPIRAGEGRYGAGDPLKPARPHCRRIFMIIVGDAEIGLGHFDAAIDEFRKALDAGFHAFSVYVPLAAAYALAGKMDEAKAALAEAAPPRTQAHGQVDDRIYAQSSGGARRRAEGGARGRMSATRKLAAT